MIHTPDISKDFILNNAVREATKILLKPYMPIILSESGLDTNAYENHYESLNRLKEKWRSQSQDFLLKMATIAWDFLNVFNTFQNNTAHRLSDKNESNING